MHLTCTRLRFIGNPTFKSCNAKSVIDSIAVCTYVRMCKNWKETNRFKRITHVQYKGYYFRVFRKFSLGFFGLPRFEYHLRKFRISFERIPTDFENINVCKIRMYSFVAGIFYMYSICIYSFVFVYVFICCTYKVNVLILLRYVLLLRSCINLLLILHVVLHVFCASAHVCIYIFVLICTFVYVFIHFHSVF